MKKTTLTGLTMAILLASSSAFALDKGELMLNGYGTAAVNRMAGADDAKGFGINGQTTSDWRGDEQSKIGGQLQYGITDDLDVTAQLVAKAEQDKWRLNLEWLYLTYQLDDQTAVRAGRLRPGTFLFSETLDVGYSYPWLTLPDEVYGLVQVTNYEGADFLHSMPTPAGNLNLQASYGQAVNRNYYISALDSLVDIDYKKLLTASASLDTDQFGSLRYSYNETDLIVAGSKAIKGKFTSLGHRFDNGEWVTNAEVVNRRAEGQNSVDSFYLMAGHRFGDFLPHVTYAQMDEQNIGRQNSWTYGLNYSLNANVTLKSEYKRVDTSKGAAGLFASNYSTANPTFDGDVISIGADFVF